MMQIKSILMVCVGNICRSPSAHYLCQQQLAGSDIQVHSAGIAAVVGSDIEPAAKNILLAEGVPCDNHRAQQLTASLLAAHDLILVMERGHLNAIRDIYAPASGKSFLLGKWQNDLSIPDPYRQPEAVFANCYQQIKNGVEAWLLRIPH